MSSGPGLRDAYFLLAVRRLRNFHTILRYSSRHRRMGIRVAPLGLVCLGLAGCATVIESGPPITNPAHLAARVGDDTGATVPVTLRFEWRYADRRGDIGGDGVGRYNPPDSLRVDLFTSGDVAMAIAVGRVGYGAAELGYDGVGRGDVGVADVDADDLDALFAGGGHLAAKVGEEVGRELVQSFSGREIHVALPFV